MSKDLSAKSLSARLVEQLEMERRMLESEQKALLEQHASALKGLSKSALSTARAAMEAEAKALQESLRKIRSEIVRRLGWITLAIAAPVAIAMLLVAGLTIWVASELLPLRLAGQVEVMEIEGARVLVLRGEGWRMCRLPGKRSAPCLLLERKGK